jgi:hypothetical protein
VRDDNNRRPVTFGFPFTRFSLEFETYGVPVCCGKEMIPLSIGVYLI